MLNSKGNTSYLVSQLLGLDPLAGFARMGLENPQPTRFDGAIKFKNFLEVEALDVV